jgi:small subunit ribosomal protein S18
VSEQPRSAAPGGDDRPTGGDDRPRRRFGGGGGGRSFSRRKVCAFCVDGIKHVDYKDVPRLRRFISDRGMIEPRRKTGTCAKHQRSLTTAIKRARHLALLSFTEGGREPRERGPRDRDRGPRFRDRSFGGDRGPGFGDRGPDRGADRAPMGDAGRPEPISSSGEPTE